MLRAEHLRVARLATNEASRYVLNSIHVTPQTVEVTDGHLLLVVEHEQIDPSTLPQIDGLTIGLHGAFESFCLPAGDALAIAKAIPKSRYVPAFGLAQIGTESNANGTAVIGITDGSSSQVFKPKKAEGTFPDVNICIPRISDSDHVITFDPRLMARLCNQMADLLKDRCSAEVSVTMRITDSEHEIRLDARTEHGEAIVAVLMPMLDNSRGHANTQYPKL